MEQLSHETRQHKNAEIYDQAYPIAFKNIENGCKGKVRKYTKVVIRCKAEQGENKNTNSMTFTHIYFIYDINDVFRAQKLFFYDFRGNEDF